MHNTRYANVENYSFFLGRHGESVLNAGEKTQGKAQGRGDTPWNGLTDRGREQAKSIYPALNAAGVTVTHVSSSRLVRARETAEAFVDSHPNPKPPIEKVCIRGLEEVSQAGWEMEYTREEVMKLREESLTKETEKLLAAGLSADLVEYVAWIAVLGKHGESPLAAALRGINALETYGVKPSELVISHSMLNRYMDAVATRIGGADRLRLLEMHSDTSSPVEKAAILRALKNAGLPPYDADHHHNKVANGGVTEYTINRTTGVWIAVRRIEPPKPFETTTFVEYRRGTDDMWARVTPVEKLKPVA